MTDPSDGAALKAKFEEYGFVHLPEFFAPELMDRIQAVAMAHFGTRPDWAHNDEFITKSKAEIVPWFPQREGGPAVTALFDEVDAYPGLSEVTGQLLGPGWQNLYSMAMFSKAGTVGQAWHQDCPPEETKTFNLNRLTYSAPIRSEIGGEVVIMPGSHRLGAIPVGNPQEELPGQRVLCPGKGDLLLLHGHCWHKVMPVHGGSRLSLNHRAAPAGTPADVTDVCVYRNMRYRFSTSEVVEDRLAT